jgi:hypothetical protein
VSLKKPELDDLCSKVICRENPTFPRHKPFKSYQLLCVVQGLTFRNSAWCSHCFHVLCLDLRKTATFTLYNINRLVLNN